MFSKCVVREYVFHCSFVLNSHRCSSVVQGLPSLCPPNTAALRRKKSFVRRDVPWRLRCSGQWQKKRTVLCSCLLIQCLLILMADMRIENQNKASNNFSGLLWIEKKKCYLSHFFKHIQRLKMFAVKIVDLTMGLCRAPISYAISCFFVTAVHKIMHELYLRHCHSGPIRTNTEVSEQL